MNGCSMHSAKFWMHLMNNRSSNYIYNDEISIEFISIYIRWYIMCLIDFFDVTLEFQVVVLIDNRKVLLSFLHYYYLASMVILFLFLCCFFFDCFGWFVVVIILFLFSFFFVGVFVCCVDLIWFWFCICWENQFYFWNVILFFALFRRGAFILICFQFSFVICFLTIE